ncbi:response regulator [Lusitaniella coriacea]|uniref:response regulator n=1 Tax=Lusitaniella coriacea TaxID=1983105 RepID=UPI003CE8E037
MTSSIQAPIEILLCEDNPGDVYLIRNSFKNGSIPHRLHHVIDGEEAMDFLYQKGKYCHYPRPHLMILDLNLPKKHGFEVLAEIKADPQLKALPVVILTSSQADRDIVKSYQLYASCYVSKPFDFDEFTEAIDKIENFWLNLVQLPLIAEYNR